MVRKKKENTRDFYINEIGVDKWLCVDEGNQIHRYRDRIEYKKNYVLHRTDGPAIEYLDNLKNQYYIEGVKYSEDEFKNYFKNKLIDQILQI